MLLGTEFVDFDEQTSTLTLRFTARPELCTKRGGLQGGFVAAYLDEAMGYAHFFATGGEEAALNLDLTMSLLKLIPIGQTFLGKGRVVRGGKRVVFLEGELLSQDGVVYARGTSTALPGPVPGRE